MIKNIGLILCLGLLFSCAEKVIETIESKQSVSIKDETLVILLDIFSKHTEYDKVVEKLGSPLLQKSGKDKKILYYNRGGVIPDQVIWFDDDLKVRKIHYFPRDLEIDDFKQIISCKSWVSESYERTIVDLIVTEKYLLCDDRDIKALISNEPKRLVKEISMGRPHTFIKI